MELNAAGRVAVHCWYEIPAHFPNIVLDAFVVMPNHVHGILLITDTNVGATVGAKNFSPLRKTPQPKPPPAETNPTPRGTSKTIGSVVRGFKIGVTKWMRQNTEYYHIWQRNYYEHIIRDENELNRIREYIINNPAKWQTDRENVTGDACVAPTGESTGYRKK